MKQGKKKLLVVLGIISIIATVGVVAAFAFQGAGADGSITVGIPNYRGDALAIELANRVVYAETLKRDTDTAAGGSNTHWAPQSAHTAFQNAIDTARGVAGVFAPGAEFDVPVEITGNTGFQAMMLRLELPPQLEVIRITQGANFTRNATFRAQGWQAGSNNIVPARSGAVVAGWVGGGSGDLANFTSNGTMLTYRLRVLPTAAQGVTEPITIGFGTAVEPYHDRPIRVNAGGANVALTMSIQGTTMTNYSPINIGRIHVRP